MLIAAAVVLAACGNDKAGPVPSANVDVVKRWCATIEDKHLTDMEAAVPSGLKEDFRQWRVNNDPDGKHLQRLEEFTRKACGYGFEEGPPKTTTTTP